DPPHPVLQLDLEGDGLVRLPHLEAGGLGGVGEGGEEPLALVAELGRRARRARDDEGEQEQDARHAHVGQRAVALAHAFLRRAGSIPARSSFSLRISTSSPSSSAGSGASTCTAAVIMAWTRRTSLRLSVSARRILARS